MSTCNSTGRAWAGGGSELGRHLGAGLVHQHLLGAERQIAQHGVIARDGPRPVRPIEGVARRSPSRSSCPRAPGRRSVCPAARRCRRTCRAGAVLSAPRAVQWVPACAAQPVDGGAKSIAPPGRQAATAGTRGGSDRRAWVPQPPAAPAQRAPRHRCPSFRSTTTRAAPLSQRAQRMQTSRFIGRSQALQTRNKAAIPYVLCRPL